jgi:HK97 family phage prohead protease
MPRYNCKFEIKFAKDSAEGSFEGYGSTFGNEDFGGDVIQKGAFKDTLKEWSAKGKLPKMLLQHGGFFGPAEDSIPIGKWTGMKEDSTGLQVEGRLIAMETDRAKSIYAAMKEGELDGLSIGYRAKEFVVGTKPAEPYRTIKKADLLEVSVVLFGMNDKALITGVKSDDIDSIESLSDAEKFLREAAAFDRKTAVSFVSRLKRLARREAGGERELVDALKSAAERIRA